MISRSDWIARAQHELCEELAVDGDDGDYISAARLYGDDWTVVTARVCKSIHVDVTVMPDLDDTFHAVAGVAAPEEPPEAARDWRPPVGLAARHRPRPQEPERPPEVSEAARDWLRRARAAGLHVEPHPDNDEGIILDGPIEIATTYAREAQATLAAGEARLAAATITVLDGFEGSEVTSG